MTSQLKSMGNCLLGGMVHDDQSVIRVFTSNGGVMEFTVPITVESITNEFPGHSIFRCHDLFWKPLSLTELLLAGESYLLLPLFEDGISTENWINEAQLGHVRSSGEPEQLLSAAPYRMSFDSRGLTKRFAATTRDDVVPKAGYGYWKVKLVISPKQLVEILSEEGKTEELLESVRTVAKCGSVFGGGRRFSDQCSLSGSRDAAASPPNKDLSLKFN